MSDVNTGLLSFSRSLDLLGSGVAAPQNNLEIVPRQTPVHAFKIRRLNTQYLPRLVLILNNGSIEIPVRRVGEVFRFATPYLGGINIRVQQSDVSGDMTPLGVILELLVAQDPRAVDLLEDSAVDPWELAEGFTQGVEQASATFPQVVFCPQTGPFGDSLAAKLLSLLISSTVAGVFNITSANNQSGPVGNTAAPKRSPTRTGQAVTANAFGLLANGSVGALPGGKQLLRVAIPANAPILIPMGHELLTSVAGGAGGDTLLITGPNTATLEVTADWLEQLAKP